jgi:hypothetical protein
MKGEECESSSRTETLRRLITPVEPSLLEGPRLVLYL